ncbi:hypothetical protein [Nocardia sp. BMG51109]|uniref:hypothetical protein n=1 Tax=Nocardia sp. BMG51109 TaxID=1056816 RepID=UPI000466B014|nr:hypothetical protein [Nocardia sp. BMG51109]
MKIVERSSGSVEKLVECLLSSGLVYGDSPVFSSLVSPCSVILTEHELSDIDRDLHAMWQLYTTCTYLYRAALAGEAPAWVAQLAEQGLSNAEVSAHRITAAAGLEPRMCRLDYIAMDGRRQIAEIQWKSGGPGLFLGFSDVCRKTVPIAGTAPTSSPIDDFAEVIRDRHRSRQGVLALNAVRGTWMRSEKYLERELARRNVDYRAVDRSDIGSRIESKTGRLSYRDSSGNRPVDFIHGQGFSSMISDELLLAAARAGTGDDMWIETPLNYIYRQKWVLALPFMDSFRGHFDDRIRQIVVPTALIAGPILRLETLVPHLEHPLREVLLDPVEPEAFISLPESLRRSIVFKCGSGVGPYYSDSKGVFRLGGSRSSARKVLTFIIDRIMTSGEPWIAQVFVNEKHRVPMCTPTRIGDISQYAAHGRFMVYGMRLHNNNPRVMCTLANFSTNWKVTGRSTTTGRQGRIDGASFTDIRVDAGRGPGSRAAASVGDDVWPGLGREP